MSAPLPGSPTPIPPDWCYVQAEELRKYVREHDAEDSEGELAWALWEASKR